MTKKRQTAISPLRFEDYAEWYQQVIKEADLAEHSAVRGCMVIKPSGYSIWENIQRIMNEKIKQTGHQNCYFPLFIPLGYLEKEAAHIEGFSKECAVVTHHRLEKDKEGHLVPSAALEEPLIIRPTSEMIIGEAFSRWIESYRDLPILINQWANIVRWEMRTRLFLRTTEFLWQEGHTVHATEKEAVDETKKMLELYSNFCRDYLAMPVMSVVKTESEKFPGAVDTYAIEAMMQDRKALQAGTSHFLGQNFSKACNIQFRDSNGILQYGWMTSWGITTRLIGGIIMVHSDDDGLVLPPRIAPFPIAIIPIIHKEETKQEILGFCYRLKMALSALLYQNQSLQVFVDERDLRGGEKKWNCIKKGFPLRLEIGQKEVEKNIVTCFRRDLIDHPPQELSFETFVSQAIPMLEEMQSDLLKKAEVFQDENFHAIDSKEDFYDLFTPQNREKPEIHGGFALVHWAGDEQIEKHIKEDLNVSIRGIPLDREKEEGKCIITGKPSNRRVIIAKAY